LISDLQGLLALASSGLQVLKMSHQLTPWLVPEEPLHEWPCLSALQELINSRGAGIIS
jgi:hypothetical protein